MTVNLQVSEEQSLNIISLNSLIVKLRIQVAHSYYTLSNYNYPNYYLFILAPIGN